MTPQQRRAEYLARAREADEMAARATDDQLRRSWENIAASYRHLARNQKAD